MALQFHDTRMGHEFYERTMPRIAKALEKIAENTSDSNKQSDKPEVAPPAVPHYAWAFGMTKDEDLSSARELLESDPEIDLGAVIIQEMETDQDRKTGDILSVYESAGETERALLDALLVNLCGWSMANIIKKAKGEEVK